MPETNWILNLVDRVTGPIKEMVANITSAKDAVTDLDVTNKKTSNNLTDELVKEQKHRREIRKAIEEQKKAIEDANNSVKDGMTAEKFKEIETDVNKAKVRIKELNEELINSSKKIGDIREEIQEMKMLPDSFALVTAGFNQASELISKFSSTLDFSVEIGRTRDNIQRMTGAAGNALRDITSQVHIMGRAFDESDEKIAQAANALSRNMGISFNEALDLIEKGYDKGADVGGRMLQNLEQYAPHMREMGLEASQMIALMADAAQKGIPTDKAIAAFDKANESIRERGPRTVEALKGIGIEVEDLSKKSSFEAVQMISQAMDGASENAKAKVLRDVFKNAGKDVGTQFIEGIGQVDMNIDNIPSVVEAGTGFKKFLGEVENLFANTFGNAGVYIQQFANVAGTLNNVVGVFATLSKVTWAQNIAQKALNITTRVFNVIAKAGPWGWIALAIGTVITVVNLLGDRFEWAAGIMGGVKNSFKDFGKVLLDVVLLPINSILASLGAMGNAIAKLFKGDFSGAWTAAKSAMDPIKELVADTKKMAGAYKQGSDDQIQAFREKQKKDAEGLAAKDAGLSPTLGDTDLESPDAGKNKKGKAGRSGTEISGVGGTKSITMNLEINNIFNAVKGDVRQFAMQLSGQINDRLRDALVTN